jgi:hypothetical protein
MIPRSRPESCLSDFALDRLLGGELGADEESLAREHLGTCERCERRRSTLLAERDAFAREGPALEARAHRVVRRLRPWIAGGIGLLAAAAAMVLWRGVPKEGVPKEPGLRSKGSGWRLGFYVSHAGAVREGAAGERVEPGDALRFTYSATEARYVAVLSVDGAKRASTYYPASGAATREEPGAEVALPLSTVLDDTLGEETIYGVGCLQPFDVEAVRRSLERAPDRAPSLPGCNVDTLVLRKEGRLPP